MPLMNGTVFLMTNWIDDQVTNAATMAELVTDLPRKVQECVFTAGMAECSYLTSQMHTGDVSPVTGQQSSSLGWFQQTKTWGTQAERVNMATALELFLHGGPDGQQGLLDLDWQDDTLTVPVLCQMVQGSQFNGRTIDPKTGQPFPYAENYTIAYPMAIEMLDLQGSAVVSVEDKYREVVRIARVMGAPIEELDGCYGGGNGTEWHVGEPVGGTNHHFVCDDHKGDPAAMEATRRSCVQMLKVGYGDLAGAGRVVNWFVGASGLGTLIGTQPCNHAGKGDLNVLARVRADQAPASPHPPNNDGNGNQWFSGKETQHPGDGSPYTEELINTLVCIDAAECIVFGWSANRQIMHYTWTNRKIDMSWRGGADGDGQQELIRRINAKIAQYQSGGRPTNPSSNDNEPEEDDMPAPKDWDSKDWAAVDAHLYDRARAAVQREMGGGDPQPGHKQTNGIEDPKSSANRLVDRLSTVLRDKLGVR
jgi:hypothetical protein